MNINYMHLRVYVYKKVFLHGYICASAYTSGILTHACIQRADVLADSITIDGENWMRSSIETSRFLLTIETRAYLC